jgi:DNA repair protein RadC
MRGKSISLRAAWLSYLRINQGPLTRVGKEYGLGTEKAAQLKAALEIGRRLGLTQLDEKYQIKSPADAANLVMMEMAFLLSS